jgi:deoxyribodipyrimidine photo-lyase
MIHRQLTIVWFRNDLRLADNPALAEATARGPVVPVYVWAPEEEGEWPPGAASRWWLHRSLHALDRSLRERGSQLVVRRGPTNEALASYCARRVPPRWSGTAVTSRPRSRATPN